MKTIELTQGKFAIVDDADFENATRFKWYAHKEGRRGLFYVVRNIKGPDGKQTKIKLQHFLLPGLGLIDHIDGDPLNNRRKNLRPATNQQNSWGFRRKQKGASSEFRGVSWNQSEKKWTDQLRLNRKRLFLGYFVCEKEAAETYDKAARECFGEFASPNF